MCVVSSSYNAAWKKPSQHEQEMILKADRDLRETDGTSAVEGHVWFALQMFERAAALPTQAPCHGTLMGLLGRQKRNHPPSLWFDQVFGAVCSCHMTAVCPWKDLLLTTEALSVSNLMLLLTTLQLNCQTKIPAAAVRQRWFH